MSKDINTPLWLQYHLYLPGNENNLLHIDKEDNQAKKEQNIAISTIWTKKDITMLTKI